MKNLKTIFLLAMILLLLPTIEAQTWKPIGPFNRSGGNGQGSGRIKTIAFHPLYGSYDAFLGNINRTLFAGSPYGGIWISRDDGATWSNTDPLDQYPNLNVDLLPGCGVTDILINQYNPTEIYIALASTEYATDYTLAPGASMGNYYPAKGVYKYTPATGWDATALTYPYGQNHSIAQLTQANGSPNVVYASTSDGIMRTSDGGVNWSNILTAGTEKPFRNVVAKPNIVGELYACGQDIYKTTNGGNNWTKISNFATLIPSNLGTILTNAVISASGILYASVIYLEHNGCTGYHPDGTPFLYDCKKYAFYKYNGTSWTPLPMFPKYLDWNPDRFPLTLKTVSGIDYVFAGQELVQRYNSSTNAWKTISSYNGDMHADIHEIIFSPDDVSLFVGHDGGVSKATSNLYSSTNSPGWMTINNGLNIATLISFAGAQKNSKLLLTGELDNGNSYVNNADENNFNAINWVGYQTADGADKMISWDNPNDWYDRMEMYAGDERIYRNTTGTPTYSGIPKVFLHSTMDPVLEDPHFINEEWGDQKPMVMDPNNPNVIYRGNNHLIRSMNNGATSQILFRKSDCFDIANYDHYTHITSIAIAPSNSNYLYINFNNKYSFASAAQFSNHIYKTTNALTSTYKGPCAHSSTDGVVCSNWTDITPPFPNVSAAILKRSQINAVVVSDKDPNLMWACFSHNPDLTNFLVWKYDGTTNTWSDWGDDLPANISITYLVYERGSNDGIYAGTDIGGVYYRNKSMDGWIPYGTDLPHAKIMQMDINYADNTLRVGTFGRGIWKSSLMCPTQDTLPFNNVGIAGGFREANYITATNVVISPYESTIFRAVNSITMNPNFIAVPEPGGSFLAFIHGCSSAGNSFRVNNSDQPGIMQGEEEEEQERMEENAVRALPNPNNGLLTLTFSNDAVKNIIIYNMMGKIVFKDENVTGRTLYVDITDQPAGIYLVKTISGDKTTSKKIIKQ